MRGLARARWTMAAIHHMSVSNRAAAGVLPEHGVGAATDVTGFGLLGHLVEMTRASEVDATLFLDRIPVLDGARESVARGVFSSLQPQNVRLRRAVRDLDRAQKLSDYPLLFDPQTAGGLLASVPAARAESCVAALRGAGYRQAAIIGAVAARSEALEPIVLLEQAPARRAAELVGA
jgi:selenide,water dikinase